MSARAATTSPAPPAFLELAGHPLRWRMLVELAHSDRLVEEIIDLVDEPQALVSYHLGRLRAGGLVSSRRSSKDGRAVYYRVDLDRCGEELSHTGLLLHPGLDVRLPPLSELVAGRPRNRARVLFAC